jgi:hypothetical protein
MRTWQRQGLYVYFGRFGIASWFVFVQDKGNSTSYELRRNEKMKLANRNKTYGVYAGVYTGSPQNFNDVKNRVFTSNQSGNLPSDGLSFDAAPGIYWVLLNVSGPGSGGAPAGTLIAQTGGVRDSDTVVLTEDLRIVVEK